MVRAIWGIDLQTFQLDDLEKLVRGGIYAVMYPTDHGKSMLLEMAAVLRLCVNPNRRIIGIKINDAAAQESAQEVCRRLRIAAYLERWPDGRLVYNPDAHELDCPYDYVEPVRIRWDGEVPVGVTKGFDVIGINHGEDRNVNHSVRFYGLGSKDLQGKRGDTLMDDIERQEEATSEAYRRQLETRVSAVLRTLRDDPDALWAAFGTPTHEESIYYTLTEKLRESGYPHEEIWRPIRNDDGSLLWADRARKVELHRRLMTKTEWNAAYELRPTAARKLTKDEVEHLVRDPDMPWVKDEAAMAAYLLNWSIQQRPPNMHPLRWRLDVAKRLEEVAFYVVWDPAGTGDWGIAVICIWGRRTWCLRSCLSVGDSVDQVMKTREYYLDFPSAKVVIEKNGQQKAFRDLAEMDSVLQFAEIVGHGTFSNKNDDKIGVPGFIRLVRDGWFKLPYGDVERAEDEFSDLENELTRYGPTAHPHVLIAIWFGWYYHQRTTVKDAVQQEIEQRQANALTAKTRVNWGLRGPTMHGATMSRAPAVRASTRAAWRRRWR